MSAAPPVYVRKRCGYCGAQEGMLHSATCDTHKLVAEIARHRAAEPVTRLSTDSGKRKEVPVVSGCLDYFPDALVAVAELSYVGNQKHNPGEPLHWARGKSTDEVDCLVRHLLERGTIDTDGIRHSVKVAWRALALLQKELEEANGLPISRGSKP